MTTSVKSRSFSPFLPLRAPRSSSSLPHHHRDSRPLPLPHSHWLLLWAGSIFDILSFDSPRGVVFTGCSFLVVSILCWLQASEYTEIACSWGFKRQFSRNFLFTRTCLLYHLCVQLSNRSIADRSISCGLFCVCLTCHFVHTSCSHSLLDFTPRQENHSPRLRS